MSGKSNLLPKIFASYTAIFLVLGCQVDKTPCHKGFATCLRLSEVDRRLSGFSEGKKVGENLEKCVFGPERIRARGKRWLFRFKFSRELGRKKPSKKIEKPSQG